MTTDDLLPLLPLLILVLSIVAALLASAFSGRPELTPAITASGLAAAFLALIQVPRKSAVTALLTMDSCAAFYLGLILVSALAVTAVSHGYFRIDRKSAEHKTEKRNERTDEYYVMLLLATLGSSILAVSIHFASFFLGLEILSVSLYVLISYRRSSRQGLEAGIKYLILAGSSSAFLLFGMALIYGALGTMAFARVGQELAEPTGDHLLVLIGTAMILVGVGFKLALAPFHLWTPDVYEGAPAPVTAFIATISKGAVLALLLRYSMSHGARVSGPLLVVISLLSILSMTAGNLLALRQENMKRLLAYSSIAHLGYALIPLLAGLPLGPSAIAFYLLSYFAATLTAFSVISMSSGPERDADQIDDYRGLFWRRPFLASVFAASILSLAGIPLTAGFVGKFYLVASGIGSTLWVLVAILAVNSAIGLYYYLRIIVALFSQSQPEGAGQGSLFQRPLRTGFAVLIALAASLLWVGIYPSPFLRLTQDAMANFSR